MMTDDVLAFLAANDFVVESRDKDNPKLTAFRRNIYFPEMRDVKGCGIGSPEELKSHISELLQATNLNVKVRDFEHLLFNSGNAKKILRFEEFIISL